MNSQNYRGIPFKLGVVTHYYAKIGIAVLNLENDLAIGDSLSFVKHNEELFTQVASMIQIGHEKIDSAKRGEVVGIGTKMEVPIGTEVYKILA